MKILLDENSDGYEKRLKETGHEVERVSVIKKREILMGHDWNVINYAKNNEMILITKEVETGKACIANGIPCINITDDKILDKIIFEELKNFQ